MPPTGIELYTEKEHQKKKKQEKNENVNNCQNDLL